MGASPLSNEATLRALLLRRVLFQRYTWLPQLCCALSEHLSLTLTHHSYAVSGAHAAGLCLCRARLLNCRNYSRQSLLCTSVLCGRDMLQRREAEVADLRGESLALAQAEVSRRDEELRRCQAQARTVN